MALLKRYSAGYQAKKSNILTRENITKFLLEANDEVFLMTKVGQCNTIIFGCPLCKILFIFKVAMILGIAGACRKSELTFLRFEDVVDEESYCRVTILTTKTNVVRTFAVTKGDIDGTNFIEIIRNYMKLRPSNVRHDKFL